MFSSHVVDEVGISESSFCPVFECKVWPSLPLPIFIIATYILGEFENSWSRGKCNVYTTWEVNFSGGSDTKLILGLFVFRISQDPGKSISLSSGLKGGIVVCILIYHKWLATFISINVVNVHMTTRQILTLNSHIPLSILSMFLFMPLKIYI